MLFPICHKRFKKKSRRRDQGGSPGEIGVVRTIDKSWIYTCSVRNRIVVVTLGKQVSCLGVSSTKQDKEDVEVGVVGLLLSVVGYLRWYPV